MNEVKRCGTCGKELPKTTEYYFNRKIKQINKNGEVKIYYSFRSDCKSCFAKKGEINRKKKRCKELGCDIDEYETYWKRNYSKTRTLDFEARKNLTKGQYNNYKKRLKAGETHNWKHYLKTRSKRISDSRSRRKYKSKKEAYLAQRMQNSINQKIRIQNISDGYVARNLLGMKRTDVPPEIIEIKRITIKLKRELKSLNIKIR